MPLFTGRAHAGKQNEQFSRLRILRGVVPWEDLLLPFARKCHLP
jgi:hypothetical protein